MIGTIRRHSQSLWWIIVAAVIVSFVWFYGANNASMESLLGQNRSEGIRLYGREIRPAALQGAFRQVEFNHFLQDRQSQTRRPRSDDQQRAEAYQQVLVHNELEANAILPGREALGIAVQEEFKNPSKGSSSPAEVRQGYEQFLQSIDKTGFTEADFVNLLRSQVGVGHLRNLVSVPAALVTPREAALEFRRENESVLASAVLFNPSNFVASVPMTPAAVGLFYTNNLARYYSEERLSLSYARFDASNHLAAAELELLKNPTFTNSLQELYVRQTNQNASAFIDAEGRPLSREASLDKLRGDLVLNGALQRAYKQAAEFYNGLGKSKVTAASFIAYATNAAPGAGFSLGTTPATSTAAVPFQPPFNDIRNAQETLARVGPQAPFTIPLAGKDAIIVAAFRERIPASVQPLAAVQARVEADYRRQETLSAARAAARAFLAQATNGVAAGTSFTDISVKQGFIAVDLPAFSMAMNQVEGLPAGINLFELKNTVGAGKPGDIQLLDQGTPSVVFFKERKAVAEETVKAGLNAFTEEIRQRRQGGLFGEWFRQKMEDSGLTAALTPAAPAGGTGGR